MSMKPSGADAVIEADHHHTAQEREAGYPFATPVSSGRPGGVNRSPVQPQTMTGSPEAFGFRCPTRWTVNHSFGWRDAHRLAVAAGRTRSRRGTPFPWCVRAHRRGEP